jgi:hypothetical protein
MANDIKIVTVDYLKEYVESSVDQTYSPTSKNAQSGKAVSEALSAEQKRADNAFANALKSTKTNTAMLINDTSPVSHEMSVKVRGKNLFDISKIKSVTVTDTQKIIQNNDGTLTVYGAAVGSTITLRTLCPSLKVGDEAILSLRLVNSGTDTKERGYIYIMGANVSWHSNTVKVITEAMLNGKVCFYCRYYTQPEEINVGTISELQIELGTTATDYTPYVPDLTAVKVSKYGKNLFDIHSAGLQNAIIVDNGVQFTRSEGIIDILLPKGTYTISFKRSAEGPLYLRDGKVSSGYFTIVNATETSRTFNFASDVDGYLRISAFVTDLILSDIQIELDSAATDYEPYIPRTEYIPNADGTVEGVTSLYPNTTLMTDTDGVLIDCEYNRDINKAFAELQQAIISLGGNV